MEEPQSIFEELCLPHLEAAYNLARWLVGKDQDAEDVVQEAYFRALKGFKGFSGENARAWLMGIVRRAAYDRFKRRANQSFTVTIDPAVYDGTAERPFHESSSEERAQQVEEALSRLPFEMREILVLRELEGWSYTQLASALKLPLDMIMSRLSRARRRLQQELAETLSMELKDEL
jgi:RNA polymerase sigma-70 factor (ECF subfamily)